MDKTTIKKHIFTTLKYEDLNLSKDNIEVIENFDYWKELLLSDDEIFENERGWDTNWLDDFVEVTIIFKDLRTSLSIFCNYGMSCYYQKTNGDWNNPPEIELDELEYHISVLDWEMGKYETNLSESEIISILDEVTDYK